MKDKSGKPGQSPDAPPRETSSAIAARSAEAVTRLLEQPLAPGLHLVATPIGNLADITLRALSVLARADVVYCEDTRHSRILLSHYSVSARLRPYHEHNAERERPAVLAELAAGRRVALISDAGTPLVSDPGYKLVREAIALGHRVECIPGASAALAGLAVSGLPTDAFFFAGFLPPREAARRARLAELKAIPSTLIFFEAPSRVAECLADMALVLGPRPAALARELSKLHEEVLRGPLPDLAARLAAADVKGEIVLVVAPPQSEAASEADIEQRLERALETMSLRDAAKAVAETLAEPKGRVYDIGLRLKDQAG